MAVLQVNLENPRGLRLSTCRHADARSTVVENALWSDTERMVNENPDHKPHGPWIVKSSSWIVA